MIYNSNDLSREINSNPKPLISHNFFTNLMSFRAFIAVDVEQKNQIVHFSDALKETNAPLKMVDIENIHITLKFLGDTDESKVDDITEIIKGSIEGLKPFTINYRHVGAFPNLNYMKVIWLGIQNAEPLIKIAKYLEDNLRNLGFIKEKRGFRPHITLARVKGPKRKNELQSVIKSYSDMDFGVQEIKYLRLKKSVLSRVGPTYSTVREVMMQ